MKLTELYSWWPSALGCTYAEVGRKEKAEKILNDLIGSDSMDPFKAWEIVCLAAALGKNDLAFKYIDREPQFAWLVGLPQMPEYDNLRDDPRFDDVIEQFNLPD